MVQVGKAVSIEPETQLEAAVIWIHGMMDNPDHWKERLSIYAKEHPSWKWVLLRSPKMPITYLDGRVAAAWGDFKDTAAVNVGGLDHEREDCILPDMIRAVHCAIDALHREDSLPYCRIAVAGFSQGAALAVEATLKFEHSLAGYASLCGWLTPGARRVLAHSQNRSIPLFLGHSRVDKDVDFKCAEFLSRYIVDMNGPFEFQELSDQDHIPAAFQLLTRAISFIAEALRYPPKL